MTKIAGALNMLPQTGFSADIKGIFGFKYRKTLSPALILVSSNFIGTETQQSATDFDANGNLLGLNNIGNLEWHWVFQQILKAFLVLNIGKRYHKYYRADGNYPKFYRNFASGSDNGRSSLRIANTFSLKIASIKLDVNIGKRFPLLRSSQKYSFYL
jgi:hypothetical protein